VKYQLETIPIWDAYRKETECPLCLLEEDAEKTYLDFYLGNSVMVPETRVEVNKKGFCPEHWQKLFMEGREPHGLGLIAHTHFLEQKDAVLAGLDRAAASGGLFSRPEDRICGRLGRLVSDLAARERNCLICERVDYTLSRYTFTILYLYGKDPEFAAAFRASKGFCLRHLQRVLSMSAEVLKGKTLKAFLSDLSGLERENLERLGAELLFYTQKFDVQNIDKPWGSAKDALDRALQKLSGRIMRRKFQEE